jgi:hypothetical protein
MSIPVKNSRLPLVKCKSALKEKSNYNCAFTELKAQLQELGDISDLKDCPSLVMHVCELIENIGKPSLTGQEKQDLAIKLLIDAFPVLNNLADIERIKKLINFLVDMNLIKNISATTAAANGVCKYISKKLL